MIRSLAERYKYIAMVRAGGRRGPPAPRAGRANAVHWSPAGDTPSRPRPTSVLPFLTLLLRRSPPALPRCPLSAPPSPPPAPSRLLVVAQDTEFPGVVARPVGSFSSHTDYHYQTLRCNVLLLKMIQLGITFTDENGELAEGVPTWQFNFAFSLDEDMYAQDSIDLLTRR